MTVYVLSPDSETPTGGVKQLYRHVDVLNDNGLDAAIVHQRPGFRCSWFQNGTNIVHTGEIRPGKDDLLVLPESYGPGIVRIQPGVRKIIFNQNCFYTFRGFSLEDLPKETPYTHPDVEAALVVSDYSREYLQHIFPRLPVFRLHNGIDAGIFHPGNGKRFRIAFMPRKNSDDLRQVVHALNCRQALEGFELSPVSQAAESEVAAIFRDSAVFLNFGDREGFGLPPAEAMACGCIVAGYHGFGGADFMSEKYAFPVQTGDILAFVKTVENVLESIRNNAPEIDIKREKAIAYIKGTYSMEMESADILSFWRQQL